VSNAALAYLCLYSQPIPRYETLFNAGIAKVYEEKHGRVRNVWTRKRKIENP
jgi:hypothetical protein